MKEKKYEYRKKKKYNITTMLDVLLTLRFNFKKNITFNFTNILILTQLILSDN